MTIIGNEPPEKTPSGRERDGETSHFFYNKKVNQPPF